MCLGGRALAGIGDVGSLSGVGDVGFSPGAYRPVRNPPESGLYTALSRPRRAHSSEDSGPLRADRNVRAAQNWFHSPTILGSTYRGDLSTVSPPLTKGMVSRVRRPDERRW